MNKISCFILKIIIIKVYRAISISLFSSKTISVLSEGALLSPGFLSVSLFSSLIFFLFSFHFFLFPNCTCPVWLLLKHEAKIKKEILTKKKILKNLSVFVSSAILFVSTYSTWLTEWRNERERDNETKSEGGRKGELIKEQNIKSFLYQKIK